ncbi:MAG: DALR domain-containing protein, partial [Thermomicrobiales bacterium]
ENEIAQSEAFLGHEPFARYWVHNGLVKVGAEKMSKSLGNFVRLRDILDRGLGPAFRLMVLQGHYRAPLTYSEEGLIAAERGLERLRLAADPNAAISDAEDDAGGGENLADLATESDRRFHEGMDDDFNSPIAVSVLFDLARSINRARAAGVDAATVEPARAKLAELAGVLGVDLTPVAGDAGEAGPYIDLLLKVRGELRAAKQWALSDLIRDELASLGITVEDTAGGASWSAKRG